jgi:hypothetical protein
MFALIVPIASLKMIRDGSERRLIPTTEIIRRRRKPDYLFPYLPLVQFFGFMIGVAPVNAD